MLRKAHGQGWRRRARATMALLSLALGLCGCQTAQFYGQAIKGQLQILTQRESINALLENPATPANLRTQFELILGLRAFAQSDLQLPINAHYLSYADLGRRFAVWNVHAAPEFSLKPKQWWYPLVGRLKYRGYFSEEQARRYGAELVEQGYDVYVEGVEAYSTLGWFADPLLNTFIHHSETDLAEIIFHELAHQRLFIPGDTDFNEAFATAVAEEGVRRWFLARQNDPALAGYEVALRRNREFVQLIMHTRQRLETLYGKEPPRQARADSAAQDAMRQEKAAILRRLRDEYQRLKASWGGYSGYDRWFAQDLNNAQLNTVAVYYELVPGFRALLARHEGRLDAFYDHVEEMEKLEKAERHRLLEGVGGSEPPVSSVDLLLPASVHRKPSPWGAEGGGKVENPPNKVAY